MVEIRIESKRYTCFINIQGKITIIKGDSGPMYLETSAKGQVLEKVTSVPDCWTGVFYYSKALNFLW